MDIQILFLERNGDFMKKGILSKILACALVVTMIASLSFTSAFAATTYQQIEKEEGGVVYYDDFTDLELYPASDYVNLRNSEGSWEGDEEKQIGNSDWYIVKAPGGDPLASTLGVKINHSTEEEQAKPFYRDYLTMTGESVDINGYYYRRASLQYKNQDVLDSLTNTYSIAYTYHKSVMVDQIFKFGGPDVNNCYRFALMGYFGAGGPLWILDKLTGGNAERIAQSDTTFSNERGVVDKSGETPIRTEGGCLSSVGKVKIAVIDNSAIQISIDGEQYEGVKFQETKKINLASPIAVDAPNCFFGFGADYSGVMMNGIYDFELANYVEVGEADNGIYVDVAKDADSFGVMDLGEPVMISSVLNKGAESTTVLLSEDGSTYEKLADVDGQTKFVNDLTGRKFQYVKLIGSKDVSVYTPLLSVKASSGAYKIKARIGGEDVEDPTFKTTDGKVAVMAGNMFIPVRSGDVKIVVNDSYEYAVAVTPASSISKDFTTILDIDSGETSVELNADNSEDGIFIDEGWTYGFLDEARYYAKTYKTFSTISVSGGMKMSSYPLERSLASAPLLYRTDLSSDLGNNFKVNFAFDKSSVLSGFGFRFFVHNNGENFYLLHFAGNRESEYTYVFEKYVDDECVGSIEGPALDSELLWDGRFAGQVIKVELVYNNGKISWNFKAKRQGQSDAVEYMEMFEDDEPFDVNIEDTVLGFNVNASAGGRVASISSFSIQAVDADVATVCKGGVCAVSIDPVILEGDVKVYIAEYDTAGKLVGIASGDNAVGYAIKAPANKFKTFVFDGHNTLKPVQDLPEFALNYEN